MLWVVAWKVFTGLAGAGAIFLLWAEQQKLVNVEVGDWVLFVAIAVLALTSTGRYFTDAVQEFRSRKTRLTERDVRDVLEAALVRLNETDSDLDWKELGLHAFRVRRRLPWLGKRVERLVEQCLPFLAPRLQRIERVRLGSRAGSTKPITWYRGKGVIGLCWKYGKDEGRNTDRLKREHRQMSADEWNNRPKDERLGLSYAEMRATRNYGAIVASPIEDDGQFIGCVSIDAPSGTWSRLRSENVRTILRDTCVFVRGLAR